MGTLLGKKLIREFCENMKMRTLIWRNLKAFKDNDAWKLRSQVENGSGASNKRN